MNTRPAGMINKIPHILVSSSVTSQEYLPGGEDVKPVKPRGIKKFHNT
jgi:hypothetical protein